MGNGFYGAFVANDVLIKGALEDLQKKAAGKGANVVSYDSPTLGQTDDGTTTSATVSGIAYDCPDGPGGPGVSPGASNQAASSRAPEGEAGPDGVAGFRFSMNPESAGEACSAAGFAWSSSQKVSSCSGTAKPVGFEASVHLKRCADEYCQILVMGEPSEGSLIGTLTKLKESLSRSYGEPKETTAQLPRDCKEKLVDCLVAQRAFFSFSWEFPSGEKILLKLGKASESFSESKEQADAKLRLLYTRPQTSAEGLDL